MIATSTEGPPERGHGNAGRPPQGLIAASVPAFLLFFFLLAASFIPQAHAQKAADCLLCHGPSTGLKNSQGKSITVNASTHMKGVHADLGCVDCHAGAAAQSHNAKSASASCITCHADSAQVMATGAHAALGDSNDSQTCITCHGTKNVMKAGDGRAVLCDLPCHRGTAVRAPASTGALGSAATPTYPPAKAAMAPRMLRLPATRSNSPVSKKTSAGYLRVLPLRIRRWQRNICSPRCGRSRPTGRASTGARSSRGNNNAASCNDCHGTHDILPVSDPHSKIWKQNVAGTCGKCHTGVYNTYAQSIHGQAVARGVLQAATCTDCHSEHRILAPGDPGSSVYMANVSQEACSRCHADAQLMAGFAMPQDRVPTYEDSYHGLAAREGRQTVANCASCHGVHNIYPSSDPRSTVNHANLSKTCGQCHTDAGRRFAIGPVHVMSTTTPGGRVLGFIKVFYLFIIPLTLGADVAAQSARLAAQGEGHACGLPAAPGAAPPDAQ